MKQLQVEPRLAADTNYDRVDAPAIGEADRSRIAQLTAQQQRVFALLSQGLSNKEIARILGLHESTVKVHVSAVLARLSCRNRTSAALLSLRYQIAQSSREARRARVANEQSHAPTFPQITRIS